MSFDPTHYLPKLDRLDLCDDAKLELINSLHPWAQGFVARSFGDLPAHQIQQVSDSADSNAKPLAVNFNATTKPDGDAP